MKKIVISTSVKAALLLALVAGIYSCKKSNVSSVSPGSFSWSVSGTTYTADNDTAFVSGPFTIIAKKDASNSSNFKIFEINLSSFTVGAYALTASGNQVNYATNAGVVTSQSGTLNITENTGTTISGNFTTSLTGGLAMTGNFAAVPIIP